MRSALGASALVDAFPAFLEAYGRSARELLELALSSAEQGWWQRIGCKYVRDAAEHSADCAGLHRDTKESGAQRELDSAAPIADSADETPQRSNPRHPDMVMYRISYNLTTGTYHAKVSSRNST